MLINMLQITKKYSANNNDHYVMMFIIYFSTKIRTSRGGNLNALKIGTHIVRRCLTNEELVRRPTRTIRTSDKGRTAKMANICGFPLWMASNTFKIYGAYTFVAMRCVTPHNFAKQVL